LHKNEWLNKKVELKMSMMSKEKYTSKRKANEAAASATKKAKMVHQRGLLTI